MDWAIWAFPVSAVLTLASVLATGWTMDHYAGARWMLVSAVAVCLTLVFGLLVLAYMVGEVFL
jgi:hypothetical protein